ncbi:ATP-binding cassette sub-family C member 4-like isoform X2 [Apostichopus japonicus]|uniref:ATP-binding cassette sub-family C member 4-like isoform X2 n=1 Tax=Stichopus japonicus TaxID=307972 RepID=UPI003AB5DACC
MKPKRSHVDSMHKKQLESDIHPFEATPSGIRLLFCWIIPLLRYGYKNTIEMEDMYPVVEADSVQIVAKHLEKNWEEELRRWKEHQRKPNLLRALMKTIIVNLALISIPLLFQVCIVSVSISVLLAEFVHIFYEEDSTNIKLFLFATLLVLHRILSAFLINPAFFWSNRLGMRSKVALSGLIFQKILRLSQSSLRQSSTGRIVNILSTDVQVFHKAIILVHHLWLVPIQAVVSSIVLWYFLGPTAILCLVMVFMMFPIMMVVSKVNSKVRLQKSLRTDERVGMMNEIINAMQVIKVHGWEKPFTERLQSARRSELSRIHQLCQIRTMEMTLPFTAGQLILFATIITFATSGNLLTSRAVFVTLPLSLALMKEVALHFFSSCVSWGEVFVVMKRIQKFLLLEELNSGVTGYENQPSDNFSPTGDQLHPGDSKENEDVVIPLLSEMKRPSSVGNETPAITSSNLSVEWSHQCDDKAFSLKGISFSVSPGEVVAVIGPVGAGKSMLLMGLLGELPITHGHYNASKKIGYASQQPWVFSGTIRENILFGREYEEKRFRKVLEQCDLNEDLSQYADKDLTLVGEKGVKLSGGQRSRVGLARVLYSDTNVYLLDDPLSAVDSRVGRHLFERCISGSSKAILLVTHQLQYLKTVDRILIIKEGEMSGYGTYQELQDAGIDFGSLLSETSEDDDFQEEITSEKLIQNDEKRPEEKSIHQENEVTKQDKAGNSWQPNKDSSKSDTLCDSKGIKKLTENEEKFEKKEEGSVNQGVYREYIMAGATPLVLIFFLVIDMSAQSFDILSNWWLATWTKKEESCVLQYSQETCLSNVTMIEDYALFTPTMGRSYFYLIYAIFVTSLLLLIFITVRWLFFILIKASTNLHNKMFEAVIRSPQQFFIINPVGRILNRFTKDLGIMEDRLTFLFVHVNYFLLNILAIYIFVAITNPFILIVMVPLVGVCWVIRNYYMQTSRDVKRLESLANSPVYSHLSLTISGLATVRAFKTQKFMYRQYCAHQNLNTSTEFLHISLERWLSINMEAIQCILCVVLVYGSILVNMYFTIDGAKLGVSLAYLIGLAGEFAYSVRLTAELENLMVATERVVEYTKLEPEAPLQTDSIPSKDWPQNGGIIFKNVSLKYTSNGQLALKKLNAAIQPKEKA